MSTPTLFFKPLSGSVDLETRQAQVLAFNNLKALLEGDIPARESRDELYNHLNQAAFLAALKKLNPAEDDLLLELLDKLLQHPNSTYLDLMLQRSATHHPELPINVLVTLLSGSNDLSAQLTNPNLLFTIVVLIRNIQKMGLSETDRQILKNVLITQRDGKTVIDLAIQQNRHDLLNNLLHLCATARLENSDFSSETLRGIKECAAINTHTFVNTLFPSAPQRRP